ncbi:MAG: IS21 family transposase [bacterium]|nr:IS21 family transposase [Pseudomonadales bacterium]
MIDVALLSVIRRWHYREGMPIREITRRTGLSRNTIKKYLATNIVEPRYPKRKSPSKLDEYELTLTNWLHREAKRHRKQRRNAKHLHSDLVALGFTGSYDRVAAFARQWRQDQQEAKRTASKNTFVPLSFAPGEAFQFDWSEDFVMINGANTKVQVAHFKLSYSRAFMLRAYPMQTHEMLFDAHYHCLAALGGIPERGIYDNMKTAVDKVKRGKERVVNKRFQAMVSHYLFDAEFCNPAAGWEKGQIEKGVRDGRQRLFVGAPAFKSLEDLNVWLEQRCKALWLELPHPQHKQYTMADLWKDELPQLMQMPVAFDGYVEHPKRVTSTCLILFERNRYSVPSTFANKVISLRVYAHRLVVIAETTVITEHVRVFSRGHDNPGKTIYDWRHYLAVLQRKPGALRNGAPFNEMPDDFRRLQTRLLKRPGGDREMADILALVLLYDEALVVQAVAEALETGEPSKQHVLNCLSRLSEAPQPRPLKPPPALKLKIEPQANTDRYDDLREDRHAN